MCPGKRIRLEILHSYVYREGQRILGRAHHETLKSKANLAMTINDKGKHGRAEDLSREMFDGFHDALGPTQPNTLKTYTNLATCFQDQEKYEEAKTLIVRAITLFENEHDPLHAEILNALGFRAILLHCLERYVLALEVAPYVLNAQRETLGYDHADTHRSLCHVRDLTENCEEKRTIEAFPTVVQAVAA
jgi:tetratricopeptide (TPR) repeat protein